MLFGINYLEFLFSHYAYKFKGKLRNSITYGISKQLRKNGKVDVDSNEAKFIINCIQLIGVFTVMDGPKPNIRLIDFLLSFFQDRIGSLIYCDNGSKEMGNTPWEQFSYVLSHQPDPFHHCIIETICDLTSAIFNNNCSNSTHLWPLRDRIAEDLGVCTNSCDLPGLLLSRQIHGPAQVRKHALLLRHSKPVYFYMRKADSKDEDDELEVSDSEDSYSGDIEDEDMDAEDTESEESDDEEIDDEEMDDV
ncbi:unnamed protein product [Meganyctiphanes norvegica]|uniref:Uncharacterized protein n=1 Tax=Meganyctiphanes norvegica TaxID=48144 RepID=A0AAV2PS10_MEGNR